MRSNYHDPQLIMRPRVRPSAAKYLTVIAAGAGPEAAIETFANSALFRD